MSALSTGERRAVVEVLENVAPRPPIESWRLFFPLAAALAVSGLLAWATQLAGASLGLGPRDHGAFMLWGVMGAGVHGFLFTAYARQNDAPLPSTARLVAVWVAQLVAAAILLLHPGVPTAIGVVLTAAPWLLLLAWAAPVALASLRRRWDATTAAVPVALAGALVGVTLHAAGSPLGIELGVHAFLAPLALAVLDRVLPFFSARASAGYDGVRRAGFLGPLLALGWFRVMLPTVLADATWVKPVTAACALGLLSRQWWSWRPWPASRRPVIGILHLGIAWFAVAWALDVVGAPRSAGLHALLVGGMSSLLLGIAMRVVRGHGGLPLVLGRAGAALMVLVQLAAVSRVAAGFGGGPALLLVAAGLLGGAFVIWLGRFGRVCAG